MRREYNFSKAVRGKFYRKGADLRLPIYLEPKLHSKLERIARRKGKDVGDMVNQLLRKDIEFLEELK
jgi:cytidylate kinase